ncbi:hypothetical protein GA0071314_0298 [Halomonas sp. HL-93]|nr:hypothetical protein GA0071314_0298 [Halomonas sp. HL-93]
MTACLHLDERGRHKEMTSNRAHLVAINLAKLHQHLMGRDHLSQAHKRADLTHAGQVEQLFGV